MWTWWWQIGVRNRWVGKSWKMSLANKILVRLDVNSVCRHWKHFGITGIGCCAICENCVEVSWGNCQTEVGCEETLINQIVDDSVAWIDVCGVWGGW